MGRPSTRNARGGASGARYGGLMLAWRQERPARHSIEEWGA
jgi:hypothetical protein